jgi:hypothetical protein
MKEIKLGLSKHEFDHIRRQNKRLGTGSYLPKNTEIKNSFINFIFVDCLDVCFD